MSGVVIKPGMLGVGHIVHALQSINNGKTSAFTDTLLILALYIYLRMPRMVILCNAFGACLL